MDIKQKNNVLLYIIIGLISYYFYMIISSFCNVEESLENISTFDKVCENDDSILKIDNILCSRKCCGLNQYQSEFLKNIEDNSEERKLYVGSNMSCNFGNNSGCVCIKKEDANYLSNRGIKSSCSK